MAADSALARPHPGYDALRESLDSLDSSELRGRRIAIDPGHGGFFRGSIGVNGLTESEANLAVSLRLRERLVAHGASVFLTRETDHDFLVAGDSALRSDLAERMRRANAFDPELFVSVHHNADPAGRHDQNETQTYYRFDDDGPSLDAAQDVHRALVRNVGIAAQRVIPGNYFVLRSSAAPALLTETSFLTNPDVEARLRDPKAIAIEAEALAIGIARYFARPRPVVDRFVARVAAIELADSARTDGDPVLTARLRGATDAIHWTVDGARQTPARFGDSLAWLPPAPWTHGWHDARLSARLAGAGSTRERRVRFFVAKPIARLQVEPADALDDDAKRIAVRIELRDAWDAAPRDSGLVEVRRRSGVGIVPALQRVTIRDGVGFAYLT
ncbi:MAG: N-acetylmuramoyl-L-alanine amidase, partial [Candidatus Eisenbacteria bacterium]|nr:N-acetylmuramoyl-L-alanine amidase [Candidatus Eisenbacteria bacterium]